MPENATRVLITGGSRGLGRAIAQHLADRGAAVGIIGRNEEDLRDAAAAIGDGRTCLRPILRRPRPRGPRRGRRPDRNDPGRPRRTRLAAGQLRGIGPMAMRDPTTGGRTSVALRGAHHAIRACLPRLRESDRASISVLVGPGHEGPLPFATGYGCAQAALVRLVESLGQELRPEKVLVDAVNPGWCRPAWSAA